MSLGVYVFSELLEMSHIQSLKGTEYEPSLELLKIFTYGTYSDYKSKGEGLGVGLECRQEANASYCVVIIIFR